MKKIVLTGGGTAGHIIPNIALIPYFSPHFEIYYLGDENGMEFELIKNFKNVQFVGIKSVKFVRKFTFKNLLIPFKLMKYISKAKKILKEEIKPDILFAKGGYISLPVVFAAKSLKIPILAHESDYSFGLANTIILKKCNIMFTSFRETCINDKCIFTGSPIRDIIFNGKKDIARKTCNFSHRLPIIMIFGGSSGSRRINEFVWKNLNNLNEVNIIHIVGKGNLTNNQKNNYFQTEFINNIYDFFDLADIVICRAGSNSIFELLALKKLMILIPLAKQSRGEQVDNANVFQNNGYAKVILEQDLNIQSLKRMIKHSLENREKIQNIMSNYKPMNTNRIILDYALKYSEKS